MKTRGINTRGKREISILLIFVMVLNLFVYSVPAAEDEAGVPVAAENAETAETAMQVDETANEVIGDADPDQKQEAPVPEETKEQSTSTMAKAPATEVPAIEETSSEPEEVTYKVEFIYRNPVEQKDLVIGEAQTVKAGEDAIAPSTEEIAAIEEIVGKEFKNWAQDFTSVQSDLRVRMVFGGTLLKATPGNLFTMSGGTITAFAYNPSDPVETLEIPGTIDGTIVTGIGKNVFAGCQLKTVIIPETVTSLGNSAFANNTGLTSVTFAGDSQLQTVGESAFLNCTALNQISLPTGVTSIGRSAFESSGLTSFVFPPNVTALPHSLFRLSAGLTSVTFNDIITSIGERSFDGTGLTSVQLPDSLQTIGQYAFIGTKLTEITIPANVTEMKSPAFSGSVKVYLPYHYPNAIAGKPWGASTYGIYWKSVALSCFDVTKDGVLVGLKPHDHDDGACEHPDWHSGTSGDIVIPKEIGNISVLSMGPNAFSSNANIRSVDFEPGCAITAISSGAFSTCTSLTAVTLPEGITTIGTNAFRTANKLTGITLPSTLQSIEAGAFNDTRLKDITIPAAVTSIGDAAFASNGSLKTVTIEGSGKLKISGNAFPVSENVEKIAIPERSYNTIVNDSDNTGTDKQSGQPWAAQYADVVWANGTYDAEIIRTQEGWHYNRVTGNLVKYVGATGADRDLVVPYNILYNGNDYVVKTMNGQLLDGRTFNTVTFAEGYTNELSDNALQSAKVNEVILPNSLTALPSNFLRNSTVAKINLPTSLTAFKGEGIFNGCTRLTKIDGFLPVGIKTIPKYTFRNVPLNLHNWEVPATVTSIGAAAFSGTGLTGTLTIPATATSIDATAFADNPGLTEIYVDMYRASTPVSVKNNAPWGAPAGIRVWYKGEKPESTHTEVANESLANTPLKQVDLSTIVGVDNLGNPVTSIRGLWIAEGNITAFPTSGAVQIYDNPSDSSVHSVKISLALPSGTYTVFAGTGMMTQNQGQDVDFLQYIPYTFTLDKELSMTADASDFNVRTNELPLTTADVFEKANAKALEPCYDNEATLGITDTDLAKINALENDEETTTVKVTATYTGEYDYTNGSLLHPMGNIYEYTVAAEKEVTVTLSKKYVVSYEPGSHGQLTASDSLVEGNVSHNCDPNSERPAEPGVAPDEGYEFTGWYLKQTDMFYKPDDTLPSLVTGNMTFVAQYELKKYTISIDVNAPDSEASNVTNMPTVGEAVQTIAHGTAAVKPAKDPGIPGYTFDGWYTKDGTDDDWGVEYDFTQSVTGNVDIYGKWTINEYAVTYNENANGDTTVANMPMNGMAEYKATFNKPSEIPTRTGYTFDKWYTDAACTTKWDFKNGTMPIGGVELFAGWNINNYDVNFHVNAPADEAENVTGAPVKQDINYGTKATEPAAKPSIPGYTFGGWYTDTDCLDGSEFDFNTLITGEVDLYGKWTVNEYSITYRENAGGDKTVVNMPADGSAEYKSTFSAPTEIPIRTGYTFDKWYTDAACTTAWNFKTNTMPIGGVELFAGWNINSYDVNFHVNAPEDEAEHVTDAPTKQAINYGAKATEPDPAPSIPGYTFEGWYTDLDCTDGNEADFDTAITDAVDLYGKWVINEYPITYKENAGGDKNVANMPASGSAEYKSTLSAPAEIPTRTGYTFDQWYTDAACTTVWNFTTGTMPIGGVELFAGWTINSYNVSYNENVTDTNASAVEPGSMPSAVKVDHGAKVTSPTTTPIRPGFAFKGWYIETGCTNPWDFAKDTVTAAVTLFAKWEPVKRTITFEVNDNDGNKSKVTPDSIPGKQELIINDKVTDPTKDPVREGFAFDGWYDRADAGAKKFDFDNFKVGVKDVDIYAHWTPIRYTFSFDENVTDGHFSPVTDMPSTIDNLNIYSKVTEPAKAPKRIGFTFGGWYTASDCKTSVTFTGYEMPADNVTVYAKWTPNDYILSFDLNTGTAAKASTWDVARMLMSPSGAAYLTQTLHYGDKTTKPVNPKRNGYSFTGWSQETAKMTAWDFDTETMPAEDKTLYAQWTPDTYTVTFDKNGGDTEASPGTKKVTVPEETIDALPAAPTRAGFTFVSWNTQQDGSGTTFTAATKVTKDITVYAQWKKDTGVRGEEDINYEFIKQSETTQVKAGQTISYVMSGFGNKRGKTLTKYEIMDRPEEGINFVSAQLPAFTQGKGLTYNILCYTANTGERVLYNSVPADQPFAFDAPTLAAGDRITGIVFSFASVPAGFGQNDNITLTFKISDNPPSIQLYNAAILSYDLDGKTYTYDGGGDSSTVKVGSLVAGKSYQSGRSSSSGAKTSPKTGDNSNAWFYAALMLAAIVMVAGAAGYRRKRHNRSK